MQHATNFEPVAIASPSALVDRAHLSGVMAKMVKVINKRNTFPILANVRLMSAPGALCIIGTDLDMELRAHLQAAVDPGVDCTVPAHALKDVIAKAKASDAVAIEPGDLTENGDGQPVRFDFEGMAVTMDGLPADDFPALVGPDSSVQEFQLDGAAFARALRDLDKCISTEETRYYLNGVFLHYSDLDGLRLVATDGHRLGLRTFGEIADAANMPEDSMGKRGVIIPRKAIVVLQSIFGRTGKDAPGTIWISVTSTKVRFTFDHWELTTKLVDGTFPDYGRVIPVWNELRTTVDRAEMLEAVKSVSAIASERGRAVALGINPDSIDLAVKNPDMGTATANVASYSAMEVSGLLIGFNASYLVTLLSTMDCERVTMEVGKADGPVRIVPEGSGSTDCFVLMPMRV